MGSWGCHLCQEPPASTRVFLAAGSTPVRAWCESHTLCLRSTFLSGSNPPPPGPCLPPGWEWGWPVEGPTKLAGTCGIPARVAGRSGGKPAS